MTFMMLQKQNETGEEKSEMRKGRWVKSPAE